MITVFCAFDSELDDNVNAGAANVTVNVNVCVAVLVAFVAVIVYTVADCTVVGVPDNKPVDVLNDMPVGTAGEIA